MDPKTAANNEKKDARLLYIMVLALFRFATDIRRHFLKGGFYE